MFTTPGNFSSHFLYIPSEPLTVRQGLDIGASDRCSCVQADTASLAQPRQDIVSKNLDAVNPTVVLRYVSLAHAGTAMH